jgi:c(7)-type cytochrome triheme protein
LTSALLVAVAGCGEAQPVEQPLHFNHANHMKEELTCDGCHRGALTRDVAGFPKIKGCMLCHDEAKGEHPDEPKVREYKESNKPIPWVRVNGNEGHVFFSHRAHALAEIECARCHGDVENMTEPIRLPTAELHSMDACMACHAKEQASNDCLECHQ